MTDLVDRSERVRAATPEAELDRRWAAVREAMRRDGFDVLVVHNHVDNIGGYVKYFSDVPSTGGYPVTVVFPADEPITLVAHGAQGEERLLSPNEDPTLYGVKRMLSTYSFGSASYTRTYDAEQVVRALAPYASGEIGLVGFAQLPHAFFEHLREQLPRARFRDASDLVDPIKANKSEYEMECVYHSVAMQQEIFWATLDAIRPGRREWEIMAVAAGVAREWGSQAGVLMIGSGSDGQPAILNVPRNQNRELCAGDLLTVLIESAGPDGYFAEVGRTIVIGPADDALLEEHEFTLHAWREGVAALQSGGSAAKLFDDYNAFMAANDRPGEERLHAHSQGYDIVERPLVRNDETLTLETGMLLAYHPYYVHDNRAMWLCDNVVLTKDGPTGPLHNIEQKVFEV